MKPKQRQVFTARLLLDTVSNISMFCLVISLILNSLYMVTVLGKLGEQNCHGLSEKNIVISFSSGSGGPKNQLSSFYPQFPLQKFAGWGHSMGQTARQLQNGAATIKGKEKLNERVGIW